MRRLKHALPDQQHQLIGPASKSIFPSCLKLDDSISKSAYFLTVSLMIFLIFLIGQYNFK